MTEEYHKKVLKIQQAISKRELHRLELEKELARIRHRKEAGYDKLKMKLKSLKQELLFDEILQKRNVELLFSRIEAQKKECDLIQKRTKQLRARKRQYDFRHSSNDSVDRKRDLYDTENWTTPVRETSTQTDSDFDVATQWNTQQLPSYFALHSSQPTLYAGKDQPLVNYPVLTTSLGNISNFVQRNELPIAGIDPRMGVPTGVPQTTGVTRPYTYQNIPNLGYLDNRSFGSNSTRDIHQIDQTNTTKANQTILENVEVVERTKHATSIDVLELPETVHPSGHDDLPLRNVDSKDEYHKGTGSSSFHHTFFKPLNEKSENAANETEVDVVEPNPQLSLHELKDTTKSASTSEEESVEGLVPADMKGTNESRGEVIRDSDNPSAESVLENWKVDTRTPNSRKNSVKLKFVSFSPTNNNKTINIDNKNERDNAKKSPQTKESEKELIAGSPITTKVVHSPAKESSNLKGMENPDAKRNSLEISTANLLPQSTEVKAANGKSPESTELSLGDTGTKIPLAPEQEPRVNKLVSQKAETSNTTKTKTNPTDSTTVNNGNTLETPLRTTSPIQNGAKDTMETPKDSLSTTSTESEESSSQPSEYAKGEKNAYDRDFFDDYIPSKPTDAYRRMLGEIPQEPQTHSDDDDDDVSIPMKHSTSNTFTGQRRDTPNYDVESIDSAEAAIQAAVTGQTPKQPLVPSGAPPKETELPSAVSSQPSTEATVPAMKPSPPGKKSIGGAMPVAPTGKMVTQQIKSRPIPANKPLKISLESDSESLSMSAGVLSDDDDSDFFG